MNNPYAFPFNEKNDDGTHYHSEPGMTLRDHFAGLAMQAMISKSSGQDTTGGRNGVPKVAAYAYEYADAMLNARAPQTPDTKEPKDV